MSLKTDYKDAMCDGARKYRILPNPDGTVSIMDMTTYTQDGDRFGCNDINEINMEVNKLIVPRTITLAADGWSNSYPYMQTVDAAGVGAGDNIRVIGVHVPDGSAQEQVKSWNKAAGLLMYNPGGAAAGKVTFKAYKKPAVDFQIITEGG